MSWSKPFKTTYRDLHIEWMSSGEKSFTGSDNLKAHDKITSVQRVKKASFKARGITSIIDGSEDDSIHYLKPGGVAHSALDSIRQGTASLNSISEFEEDPFADCNLGTEEDPTFIDDE